MRYLDEFFALRSSGDILNACAPIGNGAKEITEAMGMRHRLKGPLLDRPMELSVVDLCSGNALVPILSAFTLPSRWNVAVDKTRRTRHHELVKRFYYANMNIFDDEVLDIVDKNVPCVVTACHACGTLAERICDIFLRTKAERLILMPCCIGKIEPHWPEFIRTRLDKDVLWVAQLAKRVNGEVYEDKAVLSPRNKIIVAKKREEAEQ